MSILSMQCNAHNFDRGRCFVNKNFHGKDSKLGSLYIVAADLNLRKSVFQVDMPPSFYYVGFQSLYLNNTRTFDVSCKGPSFVANYELVPHKFPTKVLCAKHRNA